MRPNIGRGKVKRKRRTRLRLYWRDCSKLETFKSRVYWTNPTTSYATLTVPIEKPETLRVWNLKKNQNAPRPSEHPSVMGKKCQNV